MMMMMMMMMMAAIMRMKTKMNLIRCLTSVLLASSFRFVLFLRNTL